MAYFEWADDLIIDNGPIDEDHKRLVSLVNELHTATSEGQGHGVVGSILEQLIVYTKEHLQREERIMEQAQFPHLKQHKVGHQKFVDSLLDLQNKYEAGSITVASQLSTLLRDWLSLHIRRSDRELLVFNEAQRKAKLRAR
jgi:hemerythrin-like metal-binding protein